jgi:hypothetical protein
LPAQQVDGAVERLLRGLGGTEPYVVGVRVQIQLGVGAGVHQRVASSGCRSCSATGWTRPRRPFEVGSGRHTFERTITVPAPVEKPTPFFLPE